MEYVREWRSFKVVKIGLTTLLQNKPAYQKLQSLAIEVRNPNLHRSQLRSSHSWDVGTTKMERC